MQKDVILTPDGLEKLKQEIEYLSTEKRREVAERIKEAREFGDISENSEYDDAKNEQAMLESRIASLEDKLRSASVIDATELSNDVVRVGSVVNVKDEGSGKSLQYTIVGSTEANPGENKLSNESPGGQGAARQQAQRRRRRPAAERQGAQAEDHKDRRREGVSDEPDHRESRRVWRVRASAGTRHPVTCHQHARGCRAPAETTGPGPGDPQSSR